MRNLVLVEPQGSEDGKPSTSTFVFRSGGFPFRGFKLEWSLVATSLEGFSVTGHEKGYQRPLVKEKKGYEGHPPVLKIKVVMSRVVFNIEPQGSEGCTGAMSWESWR